MSNFINFRTFSVAFLFIATLISFPASMLRAQNQSSISHFNSIEVFGRLNVRLEKSDSAYIRITSGNYDVSKIKYEVKNKVLEVKLTEEFPGTIKVDVAVGFDSLISIAAGGGCAVYNKGTIVGTYFNLEARSGTEIDLLIEVDSSNVEVNKGGFVRLTGKSGKVNLKTSTGGDYRALELDNSVVMVKMNGGSAEVNTKEIISGSVTLGASLRYVGNPTEIKVKKHTKGTVQMLEE